MVTFNLPDEYGYVLLAAVSTFFVGAFHSEYVGSYRKAAKVPYPFEYASYEQIQSAAPADKQAKLLFNSAQRAHQNYNENHLSAVGSMLIAGLKFPRVAAVCGAIWTVNRILYAVGYTRGYTGGKGRYWGILWVPTHIVLMGYAAVSAWKFAFP